MNQLRLSLLLFLFLVLTQGLDARQATVHEIIETSHASDSFWSVVVTDGNGNRLVTYEPDRLIRPASVQKLFSTAAFLHRLGPDYRYQTLLCGNGRQEGDSWRGDLVVRGSGDPSISDDFGADPLFLFDKWADLLHEKGIRRIEGDLIADDSLFDDKPWPRGWEWDDLSYYYAVEISALSFNKNVVNLEVHALGSPGERPDIRWFPFNTDYVTFVNEQEITAPLTRFRESYRRLPGTNTILLRSTLPQGYVEKEPLSIHQPPIFFMDTFRRVLAHRGIEHRGEVRFGREKRSYSETSCRLMDRHESVPVSDMIRQVNTESDNFYAEMIAKTLAVEEFGNPGTTRNGLKAIRVFLHDAGVDTVSMYMRDAAGMAPANLVRASDVNRLLVEMSRRDHFETYRNSLAVAGLTGTLQHRFFDSPVRGRFYGKTGFVSGVRALSGYLSAQSGETLVVTIVTNNYTVRTAVIDRLHQRILEHLYATY